MKQVVLGVIDMVFFALVVLIILALIGCGSSARWEARAVSMADHAIEYCLWSVSDAYGDLDEPTWDRVRFDCEADYMRYLDSKWESLSQGTKDNMGVGERTGR